MEVPVPVVVFKIYGLQGHKGYHPRTIFGRYWYVRTKWGPDGRDGEANEPVTSFWRLLRLIIFGCKGPKGATLHELRCFLDPDLRSS